MVTNNSTANLEQRIANLRQQLEKVEKEELPKFKKGGMGYVSAGNAWAEKRHIDFLVIQAQIDNLKEAIKELETMKVQSAKGKVQNLAQS